MKPSYDNWTTALQRQSGIDTSDWRSLDDSALDLLFTAAGRLFGTAPLDVEGAPPSDEAARVVLLGLLVERANGTALDLLEERFRHGDNRERQAILRALPHLPLPERFVRLAIHACRTNVTPVFEAIACDNPFPADHFPDPAFNQMVLKALFVGLPLGRVEGLHRRHTPELARMAAGYASERRAAGRAVPGDVETLTGGDR